MNQKEKEDYVKKHGWYQDSEYLLNPEAWFNDDYPFGEVSIDEVIDLIKKEEGLKQ